MRGPRAGDPTFEPGDRVRVEIDPAAEPAKEGNKGRRGVVQRVDGAVVWVLLDFDVHSQPFLVGCLDR